MALHQEDFDTLIKRLESFAYKQPASYKFRVGLLAAFGYAYILLILAVLLTLSSVIVLLMLNNRLFNSALIKVAALVLGLTCIVLRSLWVSFSPPTGLLLQRQDVPHLFAMVDKLTSKLQAPRFHHILLTKEFNAAVFQHPRFGLLGWQQNYLLLGLPLMQALSKEQFCAVLAHELGHLSGNHSRFAGWIYRVQKTYYQIFERLHRSGDQVASAIFERFFNWYAPFFGAYSFVLRRMNEYEADRCAAELVGVQNAAEALINVEIKARFLESSFWPGIYKQVEKLIEPPTTAYTSMSAALQIDATSQDASCFLEQALAEKTNNQDTHPCLTDRLKALGYLPNSEKELPMPAPVEITAADEFLATALEKLTSYFDRTWQEQMATPWRQRYAYVQESLANLKTLDEQAQTRSLTVTEAWNRACWSLEFKGNEAATPLLREILANDADNASANYLLGQILLKQKDAGGIEHIEKAIAHNPDIVIDGCNLIYLFLKQQGKIDEAKSYLQRVEKYYELVLQAQQERSFVRASDKFQPHNLSAEEVKILCEQLSGYPQVQKAYLVQKVVEYFPQKPFYVLGVKRECSFLELDSDGKDNQLLNDIANKVEFSGSTYVIILNKHIKNLGKKLCDVSQAAIYQK